MTDEEDLKKNMDAILIIAELMMNTDCQRPAEFSPGVVNRMGILLSESVEKIHEKLKDY